MVYDTHIRLPDEKRQAVQREALHYLRDTNNMIIKLIDEALEQREKKRRRRKKVNEG